MSISPRISLQDIRHMHPIQQMQGPVLLWPYTRQASNQKACLAALGDVQQHQHVFFVLHINSSILVAGSATISKALNLLLCRRLTQNPKKAETPRVSERTSWTYIAVCCPSTCVGSYAVQFFSEDLMASILEEAILRFGRLWITRIERITSLTRWTVTNDPSFHQGGDESIMLWRTWNHITSLLRLCKPGPGTGLVQPYAPHGCN